MNKTNRKNLLEKHMQLTEELSKTGHELSRKKSRLTRIIELSKIATRHHQKLHKTYNLPSDFNESRLLRIDDDYVLEDLPDYETNIKGSFWDKNWVALSKENHSHITQSRIDYFKQTTLDNPFSTNIEYWYFEAAVHIDKVIRKNGELTLQLSDPFNKIEATYKGTSPEADILKYEDTYCSVQLGVIYTSNDIILTDINTLHLQK